MLSLIKQEIYKLRHKRSVQLTPLILFCAMVLLGFFTRNGTDNRFYIESGYAGFQWITIILIIECASIAAMEFQYGTIKHLIYETNNRFKIYLST